MSVASKQEVTPVLTPGMSIGLLNHHVKKQRKEARWWWWLTWTRTYYCVLWWIPTEYQAPGKPGRACLSTQQCPTNFWESILFWQWVGRCCDGKVILSHTQCIPASVRKWWFMDNSTSHDQWPSSSSQGRRGRGIHDSHVGCACNDCNGSTICIYPEQKTSALTVMFWGYIFVMKGSHASRMAQLR